MRVLKNIKAYFRAVVFDCRLRHCRREADRRRALSGQKQLVIVLNRRPVVASKRHIKQLVREGMYRRGVTAADIEAKAIYRTI
jgi:hypothetical protein